MKRLIPLIVAMLLLVSCTTTGSRLDLEPIVDPVLQMRPDNSQLVIKTDVVDVYDVVENSTQYLLAWQMWQGYAETLEATIHDIASKVGGT